MKLASKWILLFISLIISHADLPAQTVQGMKLISPEVGWVRSGRHFYWTVDAGVHWKDVAPAVSPEEWLAGVFFLDTSTGWVVVGYADKEEQVQFRVALTHDGGSTWSVSPINLPWKRHTEDFGGGAHVYFLDQVHGWMNLGIKSSSSFAPGRLLMTEDGGKNWKAPIGESGEGGLFASLVQRTDCWRADRRVPSSGSLMIAQKRGSNCRSRRHLQSRRQTFLPTANPHVQEVNRGFCP